jgi:putative transposase
LTRELRGGARNASRRRELYSIRGGDSPVTRVATRVKVAGRVRDRLGPARRARGHFRPRARLVVEICLLRQQLAVLKRAMPRPPLRPIDRAFWIVVSRLRARWADALAIVKPATVIRWHRRGFARFWAWKSRRVGRPPLAPEVVPLIVQIARDNPLWSRRRIANELAKLGHDVGKDAVAKYMPRPVGRTPRPPSQTWGTFIRTHTVGTIAVDFFTVPTVTFGVL